MVKDLKTYLSTKITTSDLAIWDKSLKIDMGSAKQLPNGGYVGFIPHGMNELHISGDTLRELASDAYRQYILGLEN